MAIKNTIEERRMKGSCLCDPVTLIEDNKLLKLVIAGCADVAVVALLWGSIVEKE